MLAIFQLFTCPSMSCVAPKANIQKLPLRVLFIWILSKALSQSLLGKGFQITVGCLPWRPMDCENLSSTLRSQVSNHWWIDTHCHTLPCRSVSTGWRCSTPPEDSLVSSRLTSSVTVHSAAHQYHKSNSHVKEEVGLCL